MLKLHFAAPGAACTHSLALSSSYCSWPTKCALLAQPGYHSSRNDWLGTNQNCLGDLARRRFLSHVQNLYNLLPEAKTKQVDKRSKIWAGPPDPPPQPLAPFQSANPDRKGTHQLLLKFCMHLHAYHKQRLSHGASNEMRTLLQTWLAKHVQVALKTHSFFPSL